MALQTFESLFVFTIVVITTINKLLFIRALVPLVSYGGSIAHA